MIARRWWGSWTEDTGMRRGRERLILAHLDRRDGHGLHGQEIKSIGQSRGLKVSPVVPKTLAAGESREKRKSEPRTSARSSREHKPPLGQKEGTQDKRGEVKILPAIARASSKYIRRYIR